MKYLIFYTFLFGIFGCYSHEYPNIISSIKVEKNKLYIMPEKSFTQDFLRESTFFIEYEPTTNLTKLPFSIVTVPFVMCMMPIIWASNRTWTINSIDKELYESLKVLRSVFKLFYPSLSWEGDLVPKKIKMNASKQVKDSKHISVLFSGGLDAVCSSFRHNNKEQLLITLHGYDVPFGKKTMWHNVQQQCQGFADKYGHQISFIHFNFRSVINVQKLAKISKEIPVWIEYTSEALSHIGVAIPLLFERGYAKILMASSVTQEYPFAYGTHPAIDNFIACAGINAFHDGVKLTRLEKVKTVKKIAENQHIAKPVLRVCWGNDKQGGNCCMCEKCLRTMHEILILGEDLATWGFNCSLKELKHNTEKFLETKPYIGSNWFEVQEHSTKLIAKKNKKVASYFEWFKTLDLHSLHTISATLELRRTLFTKLWKIGKKRNQQALLDTVHF